MKYNIKKSRYFKAKEMHNTKEPSRVRRYYDKIEFCRCLIFMVSTYLKSLQNKSLETGKEKSTALDITLTPLKIKIKI